MTQEIATYEDVAVRWLEWPNAYYEERRSRPPIPHMEQHCTVTVKGVTATVTLANGSTFRKRLMTTGFAFGADAAEVAATGSAGIER